MYDFLHFNLATEFHLTMSVTSAKALHLKDDYVHSDKITSLSPTTSEIMAIIKNRLYLFATLLQVYLAIPPVSVEHALLTCLISMTAVTVCLSKLTPSTKELKTSFQANAIKRLCLRNKATERKEVCQDRCFHSLIKTRCSRVKFHSPHPRCRIVAYRMMCCSVAVCFINKRQG